MSTGIEPDTAFLHHPAPRRRQFVKAAVAIAAWLLALLAAPAVGLRAYLAPLGRRRGDGRWVPVTSLSALPEDGVPRRFPVLADRLDAWNRATGVPVGAVYLRRTGPLQVEAVNVVCPHAGCLVDFIAARHGYFCPCHNSTFGLDGRVNGPRSPSPRGLDSLDVEIRNGSQVWVRFQNFQTGIAGKVALA